MIDDLYREGMDNLVEEIIQWSEDSKVKEEHSGLDRSITIRSMNRGLPVIPIRLARSGWFSNEYLRVYLRVGYKFTTHPRLGGLTLPMLQLASIEVEEEYRRQGLFKYLVNELDRLNPFPGMFISEGWSVYHNFLIREGWIRHGDDPHHLRVEDSIGSGSFYKLNPNYVYPTPLSSNHADAWAIIAG